MILFITCTPLTRKKERMGYDDFECMACYCKYSCNTVPEDDARYDVCLKCISYITQGNGPTGRVIGALQRNEWTCNAYCHSCEKDGLLTIEISLCKHHLGDMIPSSSSDSENEEGETHTDS